MTNLQTSYLKKTNEKLLIKSLSYNSPFKLTAGDVHVYHKVQGLGRNVNHIFILMVVYTVHCKFFTRIVIISCINSNEGLT